MLTARDIVCLSTQDWQGLWTRKQRFMQMFAQSGNRVLYIETPVHLLGLDVLPQDPTRFFRFLKGPRRVEPNLHVATLPILLPFFQMSHTLNAVNHVLVRAMLRRWIRELGFREPLLWIYTPFSASIVDGIDHSFSIYECVDEFRAARGFVRPDVVGKMEDSLLKKVDVTIVTQENLLPRRAALCPQTFCVPNGADVDLFRRIALDDSPIPPPLERLPRPRLGFIGHIQYWIDLKLIGYLAERRRDWSFALVGPVGPLAETSPVKNLPNVHFLGRQPQSEIPRFVKGFDVCLNPYRKDDVANHASPLKIYEYLAAGKPVMSTEMAEARKFATDVAIGASYEDFPQKCDAILAHLPESTAAVRRRIDTAGAHSWKHRFTEVNAVLEKIISGRAR